MSEANHHSAAPVFSHEKLILAPSTSIDPLNLLDLADEVICHEGDEKAVDQEDSSDRQGGTGNIQGDKNVGGIRSPPLGVSRPCPSQLILMT